MTELSDLLHQRKPKDWSLRRIAREAEARGLDLKPATVTLYFRAGHGVPDESTLVAFSEVLSIPIEDLRRAAHLPAGGGPYRPPAAAARLDDRTRMALDELIRAITAAGSAGIDARSFQLGIAANEKEFDPDPPSVSG